MSKVQARQMKVALTFKEKNKEHDYFVSIKSHNNKIACNDIVFNSDGEIKEIKSELSKEELKKVFYDLIEDHYSSY